MPAKPVKIPWPTSSFPGANPQESGGRLVNSYSEPLGDVGPGEWKWIRSAGLSLWSATSNAGYRGGLLVEGLSYETWAGVAETVDDAGNPTPIGTGAFPGTQQISIARNQNQPVPDVVAVDVDNGAYVLSSAAVTPATVTVTIGGTVFNVGDTIALDFLNPFLSITGDFPISVSYAIVPGDTALTVAAALTGIINSNAQLIANHVTATVAGAVITIDHQGEIGNQTVVAAAVSGTATPTATSLGTATATAAASCTLTGVTVPAGALIVVVVIDHSGGVGSVSDPVNGNYSQAAIEPFRIVSGVPTDCGAIYYLENSQILTGATITYLTSAPTSTVAMSVLMLTNAATTAALDIAVTATAAGASSSPLVTSGQATASGEMLIAAATTDGAPVFTQSPGFVAPPTAIANGTVVAMAGGNAITTAGKTESYSPSLNVATDWAAMIVAFGGAPASETVTFTPASGALSGGGGTVGAFTGSPTAWNSNGNLPEPNSVSFQDGYFFFTQASGTVYASWLNGLTVDALTFSTIASHADVTLLRGIAFSGLMMFFTTGSLEVWQDAANPFPNFPYARIAIIEHGLIQQSAVAGFESHFSELIWASNNGVYWMTANQLGLVRISPPDLDRLIESANRAGQILQAGCHAEQGKKFWTLSCPDWSWSFNVQTQKWTERMSLQPSGLYGRWRASGGHFAFGKWLVGDTLSGNLLFIDDTVANENGTVQLWRMESGSANQFPAEERIARADFSFVVGVGEEVGDVTTAVLGAAAGAGGAVELLVFDSVNMFDSDVVRVAGVLGTTEANGVWQITVIDGTHILLVGSTFANAWTSGGSVVDLTSPPNSVAPQVAISMSRDGGLNWGNPYLRSLGQQARSRRQYISATNLGQAGPMGPRFRLDVTDEVYVSLFGGTMSSRLRPAGRGG